MTILVLLTLTGLLLAVCGWWWHGQRAQPGPAPPAENTSQLALARAAAEERQRIYNDLHDDIGAKLLTLVHSATDPAQADLARAVLQDLRDVVSRTSTGPIQLLQALAQVREEAEQRLETAGGALLWEQDTALPDPLLDEAQALHLFRISREAITNALRHGQARRMRVRARAFGQELVLDYTDDGPGFGAGARGRGTRGMRERAGELQGSIDWTAGTEGGTKVVLRFPLPADQ